MFRKESHRTDRVMQYKGMFELFYADDTPSTPQSLLLLLSLLIIIMIILLAVVVVPYMYIPLRIHYIVVLIMN